MLVLLFLTALLAYLLVKFLLNVKVYPKGPMPLPLIGNMLDIIFGIPKKGGIRPLMQQWKEIYGPVYTIWFGPIPAVFICDYQLAQESMLKKGGLFVDRKMFFLFDVLRNGRGLINSNGQHWTEQRRFALHTLRDFGLGKNIMEERIMLELDYRTSLLDKEIESAGGKLLWNPHAFTELTVGNIINRILFSERFTEDKEVEFFNLKKEMDRMMDDISIPDALVADWNKSLPIFRTRYNAMINCLMPIVNFVRRQIEQKKKQMEEHDHGTSEDFVEAYLNHMKKDEAGESFNEDTLVYSLLDLWIAGQETTSTTLNWALAYLVRNPEVLKKLQEEMVKITGENRNLSLADRIKTPYLNAVVQETLRVSSIVPMNLWRVAGEDITVGGHLIPQRTLATIQISMIMADEKNYNKPYEFNPDRYLNGESDQHVVPFGLGKRACLGESLARGELYLIIGNMSLNYNLEAGEELPKMEAAQETASGFYGEPLCESVYPCYAGYLGEDVNPIVPQIIMRCPRMCYLERWLRDGIIVEKEFGCATSSTPCGQRTPGATDYILTLCCQSTYQEPCNNPNYAGK